MDGFDFQAVLFDLDGVVLDSMGRHASLWQELLAREGLKVEMDFILRHEGALGPEVLRQLWLELGREEQVPPDGQQVMARLLDRQAELYLKLHAGKVRPFPGVRRLLAGLAGRGVPAALVTSSRRALVEGCLPPDMAGGFQAVVTAEDVSLHKPHPEPYLAGASRLGADPASCLVVENAPAGIEAALAAGATCYAVCTTLPPASLDRAGRTFPDLLSLGRGLGLLD